jgi:hypothetical protein
MYVYVWFGSYIQVRMHGGMQVCVYVCIYGWTKVCMYIRMDEGMYVCMYLWVDVWMDWIEWMEVCVYVRACVRLARPELLDEFY